MNQITEAIVTIATAIVGVAILSVLVSKKSATAQVIQASGSAFSNALGVAISPVTGQTYQINTSYPGGTNGLMIGGFGF